MPGWKLSAIGFAREDCEGVSMGSIVFRGDEGCNGPGVELIRERDDDALTDVVEFVSVEADGLASNGMLLKSGDDKIEAAITIEILRCDIPGIFGQRQTEEMRDFNEIGSGKV